MGIKLLLGGSPCTNWSIARTKDRETEPSGVGWDLFQNFRIARDKYRPNYFLYENNKSMAPAIRAQITQELGVEPILINSALVSAQNRQRLYWVGRRGRDGTYSRVEVEQPEHRGILLRDVLENCVCWREKGYTLKAKYWKGVIAEQFVDSGNFPVNGAAEPVRVCNINGGGQGNRIYSADGKSCAVKAQGGGLGGNGQGLYAIPADGKTYPVYEVRDGQIAIKGQKYPIKLADGYYIIRKLTVRECMRLQTVPESYVFPVSNAQAYKMLGNGWTVDVIAHILSHIPGISVEPVEVLSMYDGMSCGHIALDKLGANVIRYYATEIDKYAIQTTQKNYPDTVQLGDAFQVRDSGWKL